MKLLDISLAQIRHPKNIEDSRFLNCYQRLLLGDKTLTELERGFLLKIAIYFLNSKDKDVEELGYRIVLRYSNLFEDYLPIHDVALSRDYIPVAKFAEKKHLEGYSEKETFSNLFVQAYENEFKFDGDSSSTFRSLGQIVLGAFSQKSANIAVVAPTSYGKSEMIVRKVQNNSNQKICVVVPSKALLAQTKITLIKNEKIRAAFRKVVTHPDMYRESDSTFLAVLTQERLLRLLQKHKNLALDLVLVDEAHNILEDSERSHLLAQVLLIAQNRKKDFVVNFFTPFLANTKNLKIKKHQVNLEGLPIDEFMKVETFYGFNLETKEFFLYDQFLNRSIALESPVSIESDFGFVSSNMAQKNIVYLNRPKEVEEFALAAADKSVALPSNSEIEKIVRSIAELIHPDYNLIKCIRSGIIYHHGGIPDIVRLYGEQIYSRYEEFKVIVTTSTLLEGVNIPAEKIFVLSPAKGRGYLTPSQFKNLIGRVCRFREVFKEESGSLALLEPQIYLVKGSFARADFSLLKFFQTKVNAKIEVKDEVENPLLENTTKPEKENQILEYLENMEKGASGLENVVAPTSEIGKLCFSNNVHDFDIMKSEDVLVSNLRLYIDLGLGMIESGESLISAISKIFFEGVELYKESSNIVRIKENQEARNFYSMFATWRSEGAPYPLMVSRFMSYWKKCVLDGTFQIYVGSKWGEEIRGDGHQKLFVNISLKDDIQRVNLAIAKIKEEQEFIDFNILKYVEILFELGLVEDNFYDRIKYGTTNKQVICMLKNGFSMELSKLLIEKYLNQLTFDLTNDVVKYAKVLLDQMRQNSENDILVFEAESNL